MPDDAVRIVCWNMAHKHESWRYLLDSKVDVALLQEACRPPDDCARRFKVDPGPGLLWNGAGESSGARRLPCCRIA